MEYTCCLSAFRIAKEDEIIFPLNRLYRYHIFGHYSLELSHIYRHYHTLQNHQRIIDLAWVFLYRLKDISKIVIKYI